MPTPNPAHNPTDGLQAQAFVQVSGSSGSSVITANRTVGANKPNPGNYTLTLSVGGLGGFASSVTAAAALVDVANNPFPASLVLTQVTAGAGNATYTGTITGGASNAFAGYQFTIAGFTNAANNGSFLCTASTATTLVLVNAAAINETHAGTAQSFTNAFVFYSRSNPSKGSPAWFRPSVFTGYATDVASVTSPGGVITAIAPGVAVIEVAFPIFDNTLGNAPQAQQEPVNMIYTQIVVTVIP